MQRRTYSDGPISYSIVWSLRVTFVNRDSCNDYNNECYT